MAQHQASASVASGSSSQVYSHFDVFINHRGPDVKKRLASHLHRSLRDRGLRVFLDDREMEQGDDIAPQLRWAIQTASVHIAIFSPRYAQSKWCLEELRLMKESGSTIIPVFYDVDPRELRWTRGEDGVFTRVLMWIQGVLMWIQGVLMCIHRVLMWIQGVLRWIQGGDGVYARDLWKLERETKKKKKPYDSNTFENWRNALSEVSRKTGFELKKYNGDEGLLLEQVVRQVLNKVPKPPLYVAQYPTGLEEKVKEFETVTDLSELSQQQSRKTRAVGVVGLGGVGKSTLAKEFFNRHRSSYDRSCFVDDVRENAAKNSINLLQARLLKELAQRDEQINGANEGIDKLKKYLSSSHRAIIVLDDVDDNKQLEALFLPVIDAMKRGSLIVVTSRNKDVLLSSDIPQSSIYTLTPLNLQYSRELFCSHAFRPGDSVEGFDKVIEEFVDACQRLPLSLKVVGALLRAGEGDLNFWKAQLRQISKNILPDDILRTLKISYDSLSEWEKQIFLDIACFFIGEDRDTTIRIWDGSGREGLVDFWKLKNRCLVDVDSENRIRMHDHLRDLGRDLAEKEHAGCRLWRPTDNLLYNLSGQSHVRGISMVPWIEQSFENLAGRHLFRMVPWIEQSFENLWGYLFRMVPWIKQYFENLAGRHLVTNMSSLQLLRAEGYFVERLFSLGNLPQLIYLRWDNCPSSSLPSSFSIKNLRVLYLQGQNLETLWQHESQVPLQLRELHIHADLLKIIPNSIGKLKHLEKFVLHCNNLETLPDSIGNLTSLQSLKLDCNLETLPDSIGNLTSLQSLKLDWCSALQMLPDKVGQLTSLQSLSLKCCKALQMLPDSVGQLTSLQSLSLNWCKALQMVPDSVRQLTSLQSLSLDCCYALQKLPDSVGQLTSLQSLSLNWCYAFQKLPNSVGQMTSLQSLSLYMCSSLQMLPDSVGQLTSLQSLCLDVCEALQKLPDSVGQLTSLQSLSLNWCKALQMLPDSVGQLTSLQSLRLDCCYALQELPNSVGQMTSLQILSLYGCKALQMLPNSVGQMKSLQSLCLSRCSALQTLPDSVGQMTNLKELYLNECAELKELPAVEHLKSLENLDVSNCPKLQWGVGVVEQLHQRLKEGFIE